MKLLQKIRREIKEKKLESNINNSKNNILKSSKNLKMEINRESRENSRKNNIGKKNKEEKSNIN